MLSFVRLINVQFTFWWSFILHDASYQSHHSDPTRKSSNHNQEEQFAVDWQQRGGHPARQQTDLISVIFSPQMYFWAQFFPTLKHVICGKKCVNFAYMATFSTSHTCHKWRISDFSTSVTWRHLKFLHMCRNFQFPHNCHLRKAEVSPHDNISNISDKYQVWQQSGNIKKLIISIRIQFCR